MGEERIQEQVLLSRHVANTFKWPLLLADTLLSIGLPILEENKQELEASGCVNYFVLRVPQPSNRALAAEKHRTV